MRGKMVSNDSTSDASYRSQGAVRQMLARVRGQVRSFGNRVKDWLFVAGVVSIVAGIRKIEP